MKLINCFNLKMYLLREIYFEKLTSPTWQKCLCIVVNGGMGGESGTDSISNHLHVYGSISEWFIAFIYCWLVGWIMENLGH